MTQIKSVLAVMIKAALEAGEIILSYYNSGFDTRLKEDKTPVTNADIAASEHILDVLMSNFSDFGFLCEESVDERDGDGKLIRLQKEYNFIVDPIDGTRSFVGHTDQFAVSIALEHSHEIVAGVIFSPVLKVLYYAVKGQGSYKNTVSSFTETIPLFSGERLYASDREEDLVAVQSSSSNDPEAEALLRENSHRISKIIRLGSCLKGCLIAEGTADIHYRFATYTKEWDTAAEEIICREAGALFTDAYGGKLVANREDPVNRKGIRILNRAKSALTLTDSNI